MKVENIQNDFNIVCDKIKIPRFVLPIINTTKHENYKIYYNNYLKEIVQDIYKEDISNFGYTFDN